MLVLSAVGGSTAQITGANPAAVRKAITVTSGVLLVASAASGNVMAAVGTGVSIAAVLYLMRDAWPIPAVGSSYE